MDCVQTRTSPVLVYYEGDYIDPAESDTAWWLCLSELERRVPEVFRDTTPKRIQLTAHRTAEANFSYEIEVRDGLFIRVDNSVSLSIYGRFDEWLRTAGALGLHHFTVEVV